MGIFGGKIDVGDTANNLLSKLDDSNLTPQEKAANTAEFVKDTLSENTERSKTRRQISKVIIYNYFVAFWIVILTFFLNAFEYAIINTADLVTIITDFKVPVAFLAVITFFYGGYYVGKAMKDRKRRRKEKD